MSRPPYVRHTCSVVSRSADSDLRVRLRRHRENTMQVRLITFLLLSGCYFPDSELTESERVELAPRAVLR